jgi:hypothetical protein
LPYYPPFLVRSFKDLQNREKCHFDPPVGGEKSE